MLLGHADLMKLILMLFGMVSNQGRKLKVLS